jgi:steroid delta-isomerase-like uncharacterized protein
MSEANKTVIRRLIDDFWNKQNFSIVDELCTPEMIYQNDGASLRRQEVKALFVQIRTAFPDMRISIDDLVAEGDKVAVRWTSYGTHQGELLGIPATNRQMTMTGLTIYRIAGGRVVEAWSNADSLGVLRQLGVVP